MGWMEVVIDEVGGAFQIYVAKLQSVAAPTALCCSSPGVTPGNRNCCRLSCGLHDWMKMLSRRSFLRWCLRDGGVNVGRVVAFGWWRLVSNSGDDLGRMKGLFVLRKWQGRQR